MDGKEPGDVCVDGQHFSLKPPMNAFRPPGDIIELFGFGFINSFIYEDLV